MEKELRLVKYEERQQIADVLATRDKMMLSSNRIHENFYPTQIENEFNFNHNLCFGCFEDGILDCFYYIDLWDELPTYSPTAYSRGGIVRAKHDNGHDVNLTLLRDFQLLHMEKLGFYQFYGVTNATTKWKPWHENKYTRLSKYDVEIVEVIPPGQLSRYIFFRNHLVSRPFDVPLNIRTHILPKKLRK